MHRLYSSRRIAEGQEHSYYVLLHGLFGNSENLRSVENIIASWGGVPIVYDLPNHGKSPLLEECTFITMAHMLHASLEHDVFRFVDNVHLLGHSLGGKLAGVYAMLYPNTVASLVVLDIAPVEYPPFHAQELRALVKLANVMPGLTTREEARVLIQEEISDPLVVGFLMKSVVVNERGRLALSLRTAPLERHYDTLRSFPRAQLENRYFSGPTLFVRALQSQYIVPEYFHAIERFFPAYELEEIDAGHALHAEKPAELRVLLTQFYKFLQ